jgi:AraC family transcriptional regulator, regulatory protein of adaptative response / DNA-3-methyladenine glycosylase II
VKHEDTYYQAMLARDYRFDGKFFIGVKTTGIYCRPICPAKPKRENVEFFPSAHWAEKKGYRPCLRCRPEAAPQSPAWVGKSALVQRALRALSDHEYLGVHEDAFAARFGVSSRHLRRLFEEEIGKSPKRIFLEGRLDFARKLIVETSLPLGDIALTSGFSSIRRFNDAIKDRFKRPPSHLRKPGSRRIKPQDDHGLTLALPFRPPFDWDASLAYYRSHGISGLESFENGTYSRIFHLNGKTGLVRLCPGAVRGKMAMLAKPAQHKTPNSLVMQVIGGDIRSLSRLVRTVRRMFDLDSDPLLITQAFEGNSHLSGLRRRNPGLRSPRGWDAYETAISSILGQLVSIKQANRMITQLIEGYGEPIRHPETGAPLRLFPGPEIIATSNLEKVGTTEARKATLREFARRLAEGSLSLSSTQDPDAFRRSLRDIKGIGPWTAEYISLRAIGDTDAFPGTDLVLKRALEKNPGIDLESVRPWRGYAAAYLWHEHALDRRNKEALE